MIEDGLVHIFDGAMGSVLYTRGVFVNICFDELNLSNPEIVRRIHQEYVSAGSEILETNTFGANPVKLSSHNLGDRTEEINEKAAHLARDAGAGRVAIVGAIGPLGCTRGEAFTGFPQLRHELHREHLGRCLRRRLERCGTARIRR